MDKKGTHRYQVSKSLTLITVFISDCAFAAAKPAVWNSLLEKVWSSSSLQLFRRHLKAELFWCSLGPRHSTWLFSNRNV